MASLQASGSCTRTRFSSASFDVFLVRIKDDEGQARAEEVEDDGGWSEGARSMTEMKGKWGKLREMREKGESLE